MVSPNFLNISIFLPGIHPNSFNNYHIFKLKDMSSTTGSEEDGGATAAVIIVIVVLLLVVYLLYKVSFSLLLPFDCSLFLFITKNRFVQKKTH